MKASHGLLIKASELGILRSMEDFLAEPLKPGRLKRRFMEIAIIVDSNLRQLYTNDPNFFIDNKVELAIYLEKFGKIMNINAETKEDIHIGSVIAFCLCFLEDTKTVYPKKLYQYLQDVLDYYEYGKNIKFSDFWRGRKFHDEWEKLNNG